MKTIRTVAFKSHKRYLFVNLSQIVTNSGVAKKGCIGITDKELGLIDDGALLWNPLRGILWVGTRKQSVTGRFKGSDLEVVDCEGALLSPAFADPHTHLVFGGDRSLEFSLRCQGASYEEIARAGGGIQSTVLATARTSEEELFKLACERMEQARQYGTGILEMKSGYGLSWSRELKILKVMKRVATAWSDRMVIHRTFLGAHGFPVHAKTPKARDAFVSDLCSKMLPKVAADGWADSVDVFMDRGYFSRAQTQAILAKAKELGLHRRLHADELAYTGAAQVAADFGALSADHLLRTSPMGARKLAQSGTVAVLLPSTAFYLKLPYAQTKKFFDAGVTCALATDFNPGSSPTLSMPFVMSLACLYMGWSAEQAWASATWAGAKALGLDRDHGTLREGLRPKMAFFKAENFRSVVAQLSPPPLCIRLL